MNPDQQVILVTGSTEGSGVTVAALHPATLMDTPMVREAGVAARSTIAEGADAVMHLITGTDITSGGYYDDFDLRGRTRRHMIRRHTPC